jgi:hypothetical protein
MPSSGGLNKLIAIVAMLWCYGIIFCGIAMTHVMRECSFGGWVYTCLTSLRTLLWRFFCDSCHDKELHIIPIKGWEALQGIVAA